MTVEQYKAMIKSKKETRKTAFRLHNEFKDKMLKKYLEEGDELGYELMKKNKFYNSRLNLPRTSLTRKLRSAFEELILNDVAAVEGRCCNTCSMGIVDDLMHEMERASGKEPTSYCFIHNQNIPDIRKGSFYLGWGGDVDLIKSILEKNGLNVIYENERTKLLIEEK